MSPDGKRVAFYWSQPAQPSHGIYVKEVGQDTVTPLAVAPRGKGFLYNPAWSPDGGTIAFLERNPSGETWLCLIPAIGGQHRRIKQIAAPPVIYFGNYAHLAWNRDSRGIIVPMGVGAQQGIYQISVDSGAAISIVKGAPLYSPALSPNGRRLAYFRHEGLPITAEDLLLQELNSDGSAFGSPKLLYRTTGASGIAWLPDSEHLALCAGGPTLLGAVEGRLLQLSANPGEAAKEILGGLGCVTIALAPDGSLVYGVRSKPQSKMLRADLRSAEPAAEFLPSSRYDSFPSFSPDGEHIAFYSNRSGKGEIWLARKDGTEVHRAVEGLQADSGPVWSPNSDRIVYVSGTALTIANRGGGALVKIDLAGAGAQHPVWSADGRSIYYAGKSHLWKVQTDGTGREALGELPPILELHASPDGRHLYYLRPGKAFALCRIPTGGGPEEIVQDGLALPSFSLGEDALYYVRRGMMLYSQPLPGGPERKVGLLPIDINATGQQWDTRFTISPDSRTVIWILSAPQEVDLAMQKFPFAR
jgi:Tol biopolymer transport system component